MPTSQERQRTRSSPAEAVVRSVEESPDTDVEDPRTGAAEDRLHEATSMRAYELYLGRGGEHGHDLDDWLQAESEIRQRPRSES